MALGRRGDRARTPDLWIATTDLPRTGGHPFYQRLNQILDAHDFDAFVEAQCAPFYAGRVGRPGLPPGTYFRLLLIGYFEGLDSERGIAWRSADSLSLRGFLGLGVTEAVPEHSTISRTRRLIDVETHRAVFTWILQLLATSDLLKGKTLGVDATTLEANAALRSIVRRDSGETYQAFLTRLAEASGIATPTRADLARLDRRRPKKGRNAEWRHPHDPDARITKMKDGRTPSGAQGRARGRSRDGRRRRRDGPGRRSGRHDDDPRDAHGGGRGPGGRRDGHRGRHRGDRRGSRGQGLSQQPDAGGPRGARSADLHRRTRPRPTRLDRGPRARAAVYANRRRIRRPRGRGLLRRRGAILERPNAHLYETGGLRRTHLRGHANILKRLLVHAGGFNLGLLMRTICGVGTPRGLQGRVAALVTLLVTLWTRTHADRTRDLTDERVYTPHQRLDLIPVRGVGGTCLATG
ncbi:MAG: transposase [Vicinamibacterales bacterium]